MCDQLAALQKIVFCFYQFITPIWHNARLIVLLKENCINEVLWVINRLFAMCFGDRLKEFLVELTLVLFNRDHRFSLFASLHRSLTLKRALHTIVPSVSLFLFLIFYDHSSDSRKNAVVLSNRKILLGLVEHAVGAVNNIIDSLTLKFTCLCFWRVPHFCCWFSYFLISVLSLA